MVRGRRQRGRDISGILLLDKPADLSSNTALQEVKNLFFARKAGHTGSLDPLATGLLPICLGHATRISGFLLEADKEYLVTCQLGVTTQTGDTEGKVMQTRPVHMDSAARINAMLQAEFTGEIAQIPPMYSALKHDGVRLYKLARRGIEVERKVRKVNIHELELLCVNEDRLQLRILCGKGTYVRTLVEDIGEALGCGAHVLDLHRCSVSPFMRPEMVTLEHLKRLKIDDMAAMDDLLLPADAGLSGFPDVHLDTDSAFYLRQGQAIQMPRAPTEGWVRIYEGATVFLGMGEIQDDGKIAPRRLFI